MTAFLTWPFLMTGGTTPRTLPDRLAEVVNVKEFGALGNAVADDRAAIQAAFDYAFGSAGSPHGLTNRGLNRPVYFPAGTYNIGTPPAGNYALTLSSVAGGHIFGAGMNSTQLIYTGTVPGGGTATYLLHINGMQYSRIEMMTFQCVGDNTVCVDLSQDGTAVVNGTAVTISDCMLNGGTSGLLIGREGLQCDQTLVINCQFNNFTHAGLKTLNANALLQTIIGGGADGCDTVYFCSTGSIPIICGPSLGLNNVWAIQLNSGNPSAISGCRSEGLNFVRCQGNVTISGCRHESPTAGTFLDNAGGGCVTVDGCQVSTGNIAAANTNSYISIRESFFARADYLDAYTGRASIQNVQVGSQVLPIRRGRQIKASGGALSGLRTCDIEATALTDDVVRYETPLPADFTVTIASPAEFTVTGHGLVAGSPVAFVDNAGDVLPTGISKGITYYVISAGLTANLFRISLTVGGAAINTTGSQSGTHSMVCVRTYAVGDQILKSNVAAGGSPGWICTTAGIGLADTAAVVATFKALAVVAA